MRKECIRTGIIVLLQAFIISNTGFAQLCAGSLGEPVVNINFGSGANPGPAINTSVTNYSYVFYSCPNDGSYTIGNSSPACFGSTWYDIPQDHTPNDTDGYMMIVNASFTPGDFYIKKVDGLCDNTTYEFAAWILNILKPGSCASNGIRPNVTFNIETSTGTVLQSYRTGDIPAGNTPEWKQYGLFFTTPSGTNSVVIRMTNNAPGGCGNDLVLDDITFRPCGPLVTVSINNNSNLVYVCEGDNPAFTFTSNVMPAVNNTSYQWQRSTDLGVTWIDIPAAIRSTYTRLPVSPLGVYQYRVAVTQGDYILTPSCSRVMSDVLIINQVALPVAGASNNGPVCEGTTLVLKSNTGSTYNWTGPMNFATTGQSPSIEKITLNNAGKYFLKITSLEGCVNTDSTTVQILPAPLINAGNDADICEGESITLSGFSNVIKYEWRPTQGLSDHHSLNPIASPAATIVYIISGDNGTCQKSDSVTIRINKKPVANAGPDKVIVQGMTTTLNGTTTITEVSILWKPALNISSATTLTPSVNPVINTIYTLSLSSNIGCGTSTDSVFVKVFAKLFIPNAFTPNKDGLNDTWKIEPLEAYPEAVLKVFNRFGQMIFINSVVNKSWDGKYKSVLQSTGPYPYIIDLKNGAPVMKGIVFLIL
ncbi:MAG: gliding motility-associated C-terminal domain-containing protein [Ginsengibacter sp.]